MEKSKQLVILCGIPGCGKSTWSKTKENEYFKVISRDTIRYSLIKEDEEYFSKEGEVFKIFINEIKKALVDESILTVVADATHINQRSRTKLLNALGKNLKGVEVIAVWFDNDLKKALRQNENREGRAYVPPAAIRQMSHDFIPPSCEEGFNKIYNIKTNEYGDYHFILNYKEGM